MNRWLIFASILLSITTVIQGIPYSSFGKCSYTGDPHLIPFPSAPGQVSNMYFCQRNRWETLLQNQWVLVLVKSGPSPFVVLDVIVVFYNINHDIVCVLIASSGLNTCPISSSVISITGAGGMSWNHWYPAAQYFNLQITSFYWGSGKRYDIVIRQTFDLIKQSTGICVKHDCPLEQLLAPPPPIIIRICDIYIGAARQIALARVNDGITRSITMACQNDLMLSYNPKLAQTAAIHYIHRSLEEIDGENYQNAIINLDGKSRSVLDDADRQVAALIGKEDTCSEQKRCLANDDE